MYVGDLVDALDLILNLGKIGEVYNIGSDFEISNLDLAKTLLKQFNINDEKEQEKHLEFVKDRPFNDLRYAVDDTKLKKELGWKPKISWDYGIIKTSKLRYLYSFKGNKNFTQVFANIYSPLCVGY